MQELDSGPGNVRRTNIFIALK